MWAPLSAGRAPGGLTVSAPRSDEVRDWDESVMPETKYMLRSSILEATNKNRRRQATMVVCTYIPTHFARVKFTACNWPSMLLTSCSYYIKKRPAKAPNSPHCSRMQLAPSLPIAGLGLPGSWLLRRLHGCGHGCTAYRSDSRESKSYSVYIRIVTGFVYTRVLPRLHNQYVTRHQLFRHLELMRK